MEWIELTFKGIEINICTVYIILISLVLLFVLFIILLRKNRKNKCIHSIIFLLIAISYSLTLSQVLEFKYGIYTIYIVNLLIYMLLSIFGVFMYNKILEEVKDQDKDKDLNSDEFLIKYKYSESLIVKNNKKYLNENKDEDNI